MSQFKEQYDTALLGILQHEGQLEGFLDAIMGFMYRKTDFFRIMKTKNDRMGFPPGVAAKVLMKMFKKYDDQAREDERDNESKLHVQRNETMHNNVPGPVRTEEVVSKVSNESKKTSLSEQTAKALQENSSHSATSAEKEDNKIKEDKSTTEDNCTDPESLKQRRFQENPTSYNGAERDVYSWSQSITDVDVYIKIPKNILKGKDVKVIIDKKKLQALHKGVQGEWVELVNGCLTWEVHKEESIWSLTPGEHIQINLDKKEERWWDALLEGEDKINVRKIDASRPMTDLDDEAQAKIEEMMFNERQKRMGLPTSQEKKVQDMLKDAWDAEGSPFKGQPFDPSKLNMNSDGVMTINPDQRT